MARVREHEDDCEPLAYCLSSFPVSVRFLTDGDAVATMESQAVFYPNNTFAEYGNLTFGVHLSRDHAMYVTPKAVAYLCL